MIRFLFRSSRPPLLFAGDPWVYFAFGALVTFGAVHALTSDRTVHLSLAPIGVALANGIVAAAVITRGWMIVSARRTKNTVAQVLHEEGPMSSSALCVRVAHTRGVSQAQAAQCVAELIAAGAVTATGDIICGVAERDRSAEIGEVLRTLSDAPGGVPLPQVVSAAAHLCRIDVSTVEHTVDDMLRDGLLVRTGSNGDRIRAAAGNIATSAPAASPRTP